MTHNNRGNLLLLLHGLLFSVSSKGSFICTISQTGYHIPYIYQWRRKVPKSVCVCGGGGGGLGTLTRNLCTFGKEPI